MGCAISSVAWLTYSDTIQQIKHINKSWLFYYKQVKKMLGIDEGASIQRTICVLPIPLQVSGLAWATKNTSSQDK